MPEETLDDPAYRASVVDLYGVLAYAELAAFAQMASDSQMAPSTELKARLGRCAVVEFGHYERVVAELAELGVTPEQAMAPFRRAVDDFHQRTRPSTWLEALVKAYVGNGIATDFYGEIGRYVDDRTREVVTAAGADAATADFVIEVVRGEIRRDRRVSGRLALFGRRLVGEALTQGQQVAAERDALAALAIGTVGRGGADLTEIAAMSQRLTERHSDRMANLGLDA